MLHRLANCDENLLLPPIPFMVILNIMLNELKLLKKSRKAINSPFLPDHFGFYGIVQKSTTCFSIITLTASYSEK